MRSSNKKHKAAVIVFLLIMAIILVFLDIAMYPCTFVRNDIHAALTEDKDVIILGSSNGKMGIDPDVLLRGTDKSGQNLCVGGEYPIDAYYITKLLIEKNKPEEIIFELDPGYFMTEKEAGNNALLFYHEFPMSKAKLQYYFDYLLSEDIRSTLFPQYEYSLIYEIQHMKETLTRKINKDYDISYFKGEVQEYHENGYIEKYDVDEDDFPAYEPELFDEDKIVDENLEYMAKLIELCHNNDIALSIVIMPLPKETLKEYRDSFDAQWDYFDDYLSSFDSIDIYNFNTEYYKSVSHDTSLYVDYDGHLNAEGAAKFSKTLKKILAEEK